MNGMVGVLREYIEDKERFRVELGPDNFVSVRPTNLRKWPPPSQSARDDAEPSKEEPLKVGERVEIFGLESVSGKKLNGRLGWTMELLADTGRFKLELTPGEFVSVKPANLKRFIHEPPDETRDRDPSSSSSSSSRERRKKKKEQKRKRALTPEEVLENLVKSEERAAKKAAKSARDAGAAAAAAAGSTSAAPADPACESAGVASEGPDARDNGVHASAPSGTAATPLDPGMAAAAAAASAAVAAAAPLKPGDRVEVHGLQSAAGKPLNGKTGMIIKFAEDKGRFQVELGLANVQSLKPENLRLCRAPASNYQFQDSYSGTTAGYTLL